MHATERWPRLMLVAVAALAAGVVLLVAGGSIHADSPGPFPAMVAAASYGGAPSATPTPILAPVTFCKTTGGGADGLHLTVVTGGAPHALLVNNAPGCPAPSITPYGSSVIDISWGEQCVDPGDSVTLLIGGCQGIGCSVPQAICYTWESAGLPNPSPCDICPTGEPSVGAPCEFASGDVNCHDGVSAVDALAILRHTAGLSVSEEPPCPDIGSGGGVQFGDVDCSGAVGAVDALRILRRVSDLGNPLLEGCRAIGWN